MSHRPAPFTFLATYDVLPGHGVALAELAEAYAAAVESSEPSTHALGLYLDDERATFTHVQVLTCPDAMEEHLEQVQTYLAQAAEHVRIRGIEVYGEAGPRLRGALDRNREAGAVVTLHDGRGTGFGRVAS